jgi:SAM-dependent methyltransferase
MALKYAIKPVCCDLDKEIWEVMKYLMKERGEEEFLELNWLEMHENKTFDLILADTSLNMLREDQATRLFEKIVKILKKNGVFVKRTLTLNERLDLAAFDKAMQDYRKGKYEMNLYCYVVLLAASIGTIYYPHLTRLELFEKVLFKYLVKEEINQLRPYLMDRKFYIPAKAALKHLLVSYFDIEEIKECHGLGYWGMPVQYVLRQKALQPGLSIM